MMYQITIQEIITRKIVKDAYFSDTELKKLGLKTPEGKDYGYVPREEEVEINVQIYSQKVEDLDLKSVIDAVNSSKK